VGEQEEDVVSKEELVAATSLKHPGKNEEAKERSEDRVHSLHLGQR